MKEESSPMKTGCVYERRLTDLEKMERNRDVLLNHLCEAENRNNILIKSEKDKALEIVRLEKSLKKAECENRKLCEKLSRYEENELLESIIS